MPESIPPEPFKADLCPNCPRRSLASKFLARVIFKKPNPSCARYINVETTRLAIKSHDQLDAKDKQLAVTRNIDDNPEENLYTVTDGTSHRRACGLGFVEVELGPDEDKLAPAELGRNGHIMMQLVAGTPEARDKLKLARAIAQGLSDQESVERI